MTVCQANETILIVKILLILKLIEILCLPLKVYPLVLHLFL